MSPSDASVVAPAGRVSRRQVAILVAAGANLIIVQFLMVREFSVVLFCTELVLALVVAAYFLSVAVGYLVADVVPDRGLTAIGLLTLAVHLTLIPAVRYLVGYLIWNEAGVLYFPLTLFVAALTVSVFYAIFLPRLIQRAGADSLSTCYTWELAGAVVGLLLVMLGGRGFMGILGWCYGVGLLVVLWGSGASRRAVLACVTLLVALQAVAPQLEWASTEYYYNKFYRWYDDCRLLYSRHSPYQKIEVIEDKAGDRHLHLNGLEYFNAGELADFNVYLSEVPGYVQRPEHALVIGSGSMWSVRLLDQWSERITTVEIDPLAYQVGRQFFDPEGELRNVENWDVVFDDAKHFLATTEDRFDLVIVDVPAPFYFQTAMLFTTEFYELVKQRLRPGGVLSIYLCESFDLQRRKLLSSRIVTAADHVFSDWWVVNGESPGYAFLYAGSDLRFGASDIAAAIDAVRPMDRGSQILDQGVVLNVIGSTAPSSVWHNMDIIWNLNLWALPYDIDSR